MLVICRGTDIVKSVAKMTTNIALSLWLNMMHVGLRQLRVLGTGFDPGFDPKSGRVIHPKITNVHALRLISRTGKNVRQCPV